MTNAEYFWNTGEANPGDNILHSLQIETYGSNNRYIYRDQDAIPGFDFATDNPSRVCISMWVKLNKLTWSKEAFNQTFMQVRSTQTRGTFDIVEQQANVDTSDYPRWAFGYRSRYYTGSKWLNISKPTKNALIDVTGWYHLCVEIDIDPADNDPTADAVGAYYPDACRIYINGVDCTYAGGAGVRKYLHWAGSFNATKYTIGIGYDTDQTSQFTCADVHLMHGMAGTPEGDKVGRHTDFGEFNEQGIWVPKLITDHSAFTYGDQGFHLDFSDLDNPLADKSGNGNDFTASETGWLDDPTSLVYGISTDTPTNNQGRIATYGVSRGSNNWDNKRKNWKYNNGMTSEAYLKELGTGRTTWQQYTETRLPKTGKYYIAGTNDSHVGKWKAAGTYIGLPWLNSLDDWIDIGIPNNNFMCELSCTSSERYLTIYRDGVGTAVRFPMSSEVGGGNNTLRASYIVAYDADKGEVWAGFIPYSPTFLPEKWDGNPIWVGDDDSIDGTSDPVAGTKPTYTFNDSDAVFSSRSLMHTGRMPGNNSAAMSVRSHMFNGNKAGGAEYNFYTPPAGYHPLSQEFIEKLPSDVPNPTDHFDIVKTVAGDGEWIYDKAKAKFPNGMYWLTKVNEDGQFYMLDSSNPNPTWANTCPANGLVDITTQEADQTDKDAVAYCFNFPGPGADNDDGSITAKNLVVNHEAGWSCSHIETNGTVQTVGHGLGATPHLCIIAEEFDDLTAANNTTNIFSWMAWDRPNVHINMQTTDVYTNGDSYNKTKPTSTVITIGDYWGKTSTRSNKQRVYAFVNREGFSSYGCYFTCNTSTDSAQFIYCGFEPRFIVIKSHYSTNQWIIKDDVWTADASRGITVADNMNPIHECLTTSNVRVDPTWVHYVARTRLGFWVNNSNYTSRQNTDFTYMAFAKEPPNFSQRAHL